MRKIKLFGVVWGWLAFLALTPPVLAQSPAQMQIPDRGSEAQAAEVAGAPAVWRAEGKGEVTLFGSMHLLKPGTEWFHGPIQAAVRNADTLTLEINKTPDVEARLQHLMSVRGLFADGSTLDQVVPADVYRSAVAIAAGFGIPEERFRQFKPWAASLMIGVGTVIKLGFDPNLGVEQTLVQKAEERGIPISSLETADAAIAALADHPMKIQAEMLRQAVEDYSEAGPMLADLSSAWVVGNTAELENLLLKNIKEVPEFYQALIVERNRKWLPQLKQLLATPGKHLVVVGAAHLVGPDSLVAMLQADGDRVSRMADPAAGRRAAP